MRRKELIAAQDGITIRYTGEQLDQADLDVWEQVLHLARTQALGTQCRFTEKGFLKALGRSSQARAVDEWLRSAFAPAGRGYGGRDLMTVRWTYGGNAVGGFSPRRGHRPAPSWRSTLNWPSSIGRSRWTQIDWEQRQRLRGKPLALWLHGFYASHAAPYPLTVAYLHKLSGSRTKQLRNFKRKSHPGAAGSRSGIGAIRSFEIRDELVHVWTVPSKSQQKHLAARRPPDRRRK